MYSMDQFTLQPSEGKRNILPMEILEHLKNKIRLKHIQILIVILGTANSRYKINLKSTFRVWDRSKYTRRKIYAIDKPLYHSCRNAQKHNASSLVIKLVQTWLNLISTSYGKSNETCLWSVYNEKLADLSTNISEEYIYKSYTQL